MFSWLDHFVKDVRFGIRNLAKARGFAALAIGSLALGIGGSTAMYSVIHAVILDPFPYKDPGRLMSVNVRGQRGGNGSYYGIDQFLDISERNTVFSGVVASTWSDVTWTGEGDPQRLRGNHCTMNTFDVMGVMPLIGRSTTAADEAPGAEPVTLLGFKFWQRQFGGDPSVLGRKLRLNDKVRTVIGVMPPRFMWRGADVYLPDVFHHGQTVEGEREVHLLGRLKPGITRAQATAELGPLFQEMQRQHPDDFPKSWRLVLQDFGETFPSGIQDALWILFGAVGLLLLIACVNVSNLLLSRAAYRRREIAIRGALGAQRSRLVRQLLAESLVLAACGGAVGVVLAVAGLRGIIAMVPPNTIPDEAQIALNTPVLLFSLAVSVGAALLFGLAPALHLAGGDVLTPLKEAGRGTAGGLRQRVLRGVLVVGEVALSLMLLVGASLMIRTLISIQGVNLAFHPERILTLRIPFSEQRYPDAARRDAFLQEALRRMRNVPGVQAVGINGGMPPVYNWQMPVTLEGQSQPEPQFAIFHQTNADYLKVMGIPLVRGRFLDGAGSQCPDPQHDGEPGFRKEVFRGRRCPRTHGAGAAAEDAAVRDVRRRLPDRGRGAGHHQPRDDARDCAGDVRAVHHHGIRGPPLRAGTGAARIARARGQGAGVRGGPGAAGDGHEADGPGAGRERLRAPALQPAAVRSVRGFRAGAGAVRDLRRDLAGGGAADARDRHSDRAGRRVRPGDRNGARRWG